MTIYNSLTLTPTKTTRYSPPSMTPFNEFSQTYRERVNQMLSEKLKQGRHYEQHLNDAMAYSLLSGGKRVRPLLAYAAALAIGKCTA